MESEPRARIRKMAYAALFAALMAAGAWISLPLPYVPLTLQTLFVLIAGAVLGPYFGALATLVYVLLGLIGLPVFARGQAGLGVLAGPTGGYLVGFFLCAIVVGLLAKVKPGHRFLWLCLAMALGTGVIYLCGAAWLAFTAHLSLEAAFIAGVLPFVPGDILKIICGAAVASRLEV